ncbi:MAG: CapA family protein [Flavobacteriaceae bacterium]|nr:CapA family protein [Flavobacteriaceae bacterium]
MRVSFIGDVSFTGSFKDKADSFDSNIISDEILDIFYNSDYTVCNLEGGTTNEECIKSRSLNVKSPLATIKYLKNKKINVYGLANNHMFDAGYKGFKDTGNQLKLNKVECFGAGNNITEASSILYLRKNEISIAIIGIGHNDGLVASENSPGIFSYIQEDILYKQIIEAKKNADWVIVSCHSGPEFNFYPTPTVRNKLNKILKNGADIIIGHHSHTMQGVEKRENNKLIAYSLGNFIFDLSSQRKKKDYNIGLIVTIEFNKKTYSVKHQPIEIDYKTAKVKLAPKKYFIKLNEISDFSNYNKKIVRDSIRVIFFNPFLPTKVSFRFFVYLLFYPFVVGYKIYVLSGYNREFVDIILSYYNLSFLKKVLKKDDFYINN